ncbi:MAG: extracellular solute-binding protein [Erysipelotrichaceae bacterium]|nr:extracellular solute-binding protein [Erysipelotrichaceae bacterium]
MKKLLTVLLALLMVLGLAACQKEQKPAEEQTVVIWSTYTKEQKDYLEKAVDDFNAQHEGEIKVVHEPQEYNGFSDKVYQAVMAGNGPDIIIDYASTAAVYVEDGDKVADVGKYLSKETINALTEGAKEEATSFSDGKLHILPIVFSGPVLFYNPKYVTEAGLKVPTTWAEVEEVSKQIHAANPKVYGWAADSTTDVAQSIMMQLGVKIFDTEKMECDFNTPEVVEAMNWYGKGVTEGYFLGAPTIDNYFSSDYNAGNLAMYVGSVAGAPYLTEGTWAVAKMPQTEGGTPWTPAWNRGIIIFASNEAKEAATAKFAEYFATPEVNAGWCVACNYQTAFTTTMENETYKNLLANSATLNALDPETAGSFKAISATQYVRKALQDMMAAVAAGTDAATAVKAAVDYVANELQ